MRERSPGVWELAVVHGIDADGRPRRAMRTFRGPAVEASKALAAFVVDLDKDGMPERSPRRGGPTVDDLVQEYWLYAETQGRAHSTLVAYRDAYKRWVRPPLGHLRADRVSQRDLDRAFGPMRTAGQSHSRMNQAKVVLSNAYRLGKRYHLVTKQSPVAGYELPRSTKGRREVVVPETAEVVARDAGGTIVVVDLTKTGKSRTLAIDTVTVQMLTDLFEQQDADGATAGLTIQPDGYVFGLLGSHRKPMRPEYMTRKMREVGAALTLPAGSFDATILALRTFTTTSSEPGPTRVRHVFPCGITRPKRQQLELPGRAEIIANSVITRMGMQGKVCLYTSALTHLIIDGSGEFFPAAFEGLLAPARLLDTRIQPTVDGQFTNLGRVAGATTLQVTVGGRGGLAGTAPTSALKVTVVIPEWRVRHRLSFRPVAPTSATSILKPARSSRTPSSPGRHPKASCLSTSPRRTSSLRWRV